MRNPNYRSTTDYSVKINPIYRDIDLFTKVVNVLNTNDKQVEVFSIKYRDINKLIDLFRDLLRDADKYQYRVIIEKAVKEKISSHIELFVKLGFQDCPLYMIRPSKANLEYCAFDMVNGYEKDDKIVVNSKGTSYIVRNIYKEVLLITDSYSEAHEYFENNKGQSFVKASSK